MSLLMMLMSILWRCSGTVSDEVIKVGSCPAICDLFVNLFALILSAASLRTKKLTGRLLRIVGLGIIKNRNLRAYNPS